MVHELHRLSPALVFEENDGIVAFLLEIETDGRTDPFFRSFDDFPKDALGTQLEHLHVETALRKPELDDSAAGAFALRVGRPPSGKTVERCQRPIDIIQTRFDSNSV